MGNYTTDNGGKQDGQMLPLGINANIDASQYHRTLGLTKSGLSKLYKSPAHFWDWMNSPPDKSSDNMDLGTATHTLVFEPEKWDKEILVLPADAPKKPTKTQLEAEEKSEKALASINWWDDFNKKAAGRVVIDSEQENNARKMAASVLGSEDCIPLLKHPSAQAELSITAIEKVKGLDIACKMRCDLLTMDGKIIVDLKTTADSSEEKFTSKFFSLGYWLQAAHYMRTAQLAGLPVERFIFIAVENTSPYSVALYELDEKSLETALAIRWRLLETLANCIATGKYPPHSKGIKRIKMPNWIN